MVNPAEISGQRLAVLFWGLTDTGDDEAVVLAGIAKWDGESLTIDLGPDRDAFTIPRHAIERIEPVSADVRDTLCEAAFVVTLTVGPLPDGADPKDYIPTGLKWPDAEEP